MRGIGGLDPNTASHPSAEEAVEPRVEFRAQAGDGRDLAPQVGAELGGEGVGRRVEQELWPLLWCWLLAPEEAVYVAGRVGYAEDQARQVRHRAGPEELVEDELVYVVAPEVVEDTALVGVDDDRARLVDDSVPRLHYLLAPTQVLGEVCLAEWELLPDLAAQAGAHVVEGGYAAVILQVLDHGGQPPFVEWHGVLNRKGHVLSG